MGTAEPSITEVLIDYYYLFLFSCYFVWDSRFSDTLYQRNIIHFNLSNVLCIKIFKFEMREDTISIPLYRLAAISFNKIMFNA